MVSDFLTTSMNPTLLPVDRAPYGNILRELGNERMGMRIMMVLGNEGMKYKKMME